MEKGPLISVVISTYNCAAYIQETLGSVINQKFRHIEILIVDDGSTDATPERINELALSDSRVRVFLLNHSGSPAKTRNFGISKSSGRFIALLDGDDIWTPDKLSVQVKKLLNTPSSVLVYSMSVTFGESGLFSPFYEVLPLIFKGAVNRGDYNH